MENLGRRNVGKWRGEGTRHRASWRAKKLGMLSQYKQR